VGREDNVFVKGNRNMLDKLEVLENIKTLATMKKIPMKEVERGSGVSVGYYARLISDIKAAFEKRNDPIEFGEGKTSKTRGRPLPPTDVMAYTADILGVSVDALLNYEFKALNDAEVALVVFCDNLTRSTEKNKLIWKKDDYSVIYSQSPIEGFEHYPLAKCTDDNVEGQRTLSYFSFFENQFARLNDNCVYRLSYKGKILLLAQTVDQIFNEQPILGLEFYDVSNGNVIKLAHDKCGALDDEGIKFSAMNSLYKVAKKSSDNNPNGEEITKVIHDIMLHFGFNE